MDVYFCLKRYHENYFILGSCQSLEMIKNVPSKNISKEHTSHFAILPSVLNEVCAPGIHVFLKFFTLKLLNIYITSCCPDHAARARLQADGSGDDDHDQRSWRPEPGLQGGRCHGHQGPHQHARFRRNQPSGWTQRRQVGGGEGGTDAWMNVFMRVNT